jgi:hypothetical protein
MRPDHKPRWIILPVVGLTLIVVFVLHGLLDDRPPRPGEWLGRTLDEWRSVGRMLAGYGLFGVLVGSWVIGELLVRVSRARPLAGSADDPRCPSCGYSRKGLSQDAICPECGGDPHEQPKTVIEPGGRLLGLIWIVAPIAAGSFVALQAFDPPKVIILVLPCLSILLVILGCLRPTLSNGQAYFLAAMTASGLAFITIAFGSTNDPFGLLSVMMCPGFAWMFAGPAYFLGGLGLWIHKRFWKRSPD